MGENPAKMQFVKVEKMVQPRWSVMTAGLIEKVANSNVLVRFFIALHFIKDNGQKCRDCISRFQPDFCVFDFRQPRFWRDQRQTKSNWTPSNQTTAATSNMCSYATSISWLEDSQSVSQSFSQSVSHSVSHSVSQLVIQSVSQSISHSVSQSVIVIPLLFSQCCARQE